MVLKIQLRTKSLLIQGSHPHGTVNKYNVRCRRACEDLTGCSEENRVGQRGEEGGGSFLEKKVVDISENNFKKLTLCSSLKHLLG